MNDFAMNILIKFDKDDEVWLAHCLELDLIESGETPLASIRQLLRNIECQLEECAKDGLNPIHPAAKEDWELLSRAKPVSLSDLKDKSSKSFSVPPHVVLRELNI